MRSEGLLKHLMICLVISLVFYIAFFTLVQRRRNAKQPWEVVFRADASGAPALLVSQTNLSISETILFPGQAVQPGNLSKAISFNQPQSELPFGNLIFQDSTFLPGTVTMRLFGHEVELLPRVLIVDKKEIPWQSGGVIQVFDTNAPRSTAGQLAVPNASRAAPVQ